MGETSDGVRRKRGRQEEERREERRSKEMMGQHPAQDPYQARTNTNCNFKSSFIGQFAVGTV